MNGVALLFTVVAIGMLVWVLAEKYAPEWLNGFKTWALNIIASIPVFGPELARLLMEHDMGQYISQENMIYYMGAVILLNLFARARTHSPFMGR